MHKRKTTDQDVTYLCSNGTTLRVHVAKVAAEVLQHVARDPTRLTPREFDCLVYKLLGWRAKAIISMFTTDGSKYGLHDLASTMWHVRTKLCVVNDFEMAYMAYERGWVVMEETLNSAGKPVPILAAPKVMHPGDDYQCCSPTCDWVGPWSATVHLKHDNKPLCPVCKEVTEPETGECGGGAPMGVSPSPYYR